MNSNFALDDVLYNVIYIHKAAFLLCVCVCAVKYFAGCDWSIGKDLARFLANTVQVYSALYIL